MVDEDRDWYRRVYFMAHAYHGRRGPDAWSQKKQVQIFDAVCALGDWFRASGIAKPDAYQALMAEIVIAEDQSMTPRA